MRYAWLGVILIAALVLPLVIGEYWIHVAIEILIMGLFAVSFNMIFGCMGQLNFAIAGMFAGLAGGLLGPFNRSIAPDLCNWQESGVPVFMAVIGGSLSFLGQ
jgi:branched-chain amino acid transport system permease protein